jgi:hypothetical protein
MTRLLAIPLLVVGLASSVGAQEQAQDPAPIASSMNLPGNLANTSAASAPVPKPAGWTLASLAPPQTSLDALFFSSLPDFNPQPVSAGTPRAWPASPSPAAPNPGAFDYAERGYRWEISLGFALIRFRTSVYYASLAGFHSSLAYFMTDWIAIEGATNTGFAPEIFDREHVKYLGYGAGPRFSLGYHARRLEPWVHALIGGVHLIPQTALGGQNALELTAGGGVDFLFNPRVSSRLELDYLWSHLFGQQQNSAQGSLGFVFNF